MCLGLPSGFSKHWKVVDVLRLEVQEPAYSLLVPDGGRFVIEGNVLACDARYHPDTRQRRRRQAA